MSAPRYQAAFDRFASHLLPPAKDQIIELSAGRGTYTKQFLEKGYPILACGLLGELDVSEDQRKRLIVSLKAAEDIPVPYRTCAGVFCCDALAERPKQAVFVSLRLFADWLIPGGICYGLFYEGEGVKRITEQGIQGLKERLLVYYQPEELDDLIGSASLETVDAWRDEEQQRRVLHVIMRRPL